MMRSIYIGALLVLLTSIPIAPVIGNPHSFHENEIMWWHHWIYDMNRNRIEDSIETGRGRLFDIFVDYDHRPTEEDVRALEDLGVNVTYVAKYIDTIVAYKVPRNLIYDIARLEHVVMVEEQPFMVSMLDVSSPATKSRQSSMYSPETAWDLGYTGKNITIAILDTGVDDGHESLQGKYVDGVDVSNPGLIIYVNPDDGNGHGTHVAGIAMGNGGNTDNDGDGEPDYMGTAPDALLVDVKIGNDVGFSAGTMIEGIEWCIENKDEDDIRIISISFGEANGDSDGNDSVSRAVNRAVEEGIVVVVAAGNDGPDNRGLGSPAAADKAIVVANVNDQGTISRRDDEIHPTSSRGPRRSDGDDDPYDELKPDVSAPGTNIMSARYAEIGQMGYGYTEKSGTSMSAPHVSGIVAMMLQANPDLTPNQVKEILHQSAEPRGRPTYPALSSKYNTSYGYGIVDAYWAVMISLTGNASTGHTTDTGLRCQIVEPADNTTVGGLLTVRGTASSNRTEIERVEVRWDDGRWMNASQINGSWYHWFITLNTQNLSNGWHNLSARAISYTLASPTDTIRVKVQNDHRNDVKKWWEIPSSGWELSSAVFIAAVMIYALRRR